MRRSLMAAAALACLALPALAQDAASKVAVTIYNDDLSLVEDVRMLSLTAGRQRIEFPGVSAEIQAETVALGAEGVEVIEQNFDFDLLTPGAMMEKAVGSTIKLVRTNPATGKETIEAAKVLSANGGVVLQIGDRIEVLRDDGLPVRVLFDKIPDNLRARPTLSVQINNKGAGAKPLSLRYLTRGLGWKADYVGVFDDKSGRLDLQGWVTLTNTSGAAYRNASIQLVAGSPGQGGAPISGAVRGGRGGRGGDDTQFGDYHLYILKEQTTIAENQTKQVSFLAADGVKARKVYMVERTGFGSERQPSGAAVRLFFANDEASGLGEPLPAGVMRLYARDSSGRPQFIGEDRLGHMPEGSELNLAIGQAFDVTAQATVEKQDSPVKGVTVTAMRYAFRNARNEPAMIRFVLSGLNEIRSYSSPTIKPERIDANTDAFDVPLAARGETVLTFNVRQGKEIRE
ncbi:MAG: DUF4139 domain-containing protein [Caulobacterales bacterium]|jgi:hypothetical protein